MFKIRLNTAIFMNVDWTSQEPHLTQWPCSAGHRVVFYVDLICRDFPRKLLNYVAKFVQKFLRLNPHWSLLLKVFLLSSEITVEVSLLFQGSLLPITCNYFWLYCTYVPRGNVCNSTTVHFDYSPDCWIAVVADFKCMSINLRFFSLLEYTCISTRAV